MRPAIVAVALLGAVVSAETIYFEDGTAVEVPVGSSVYVAEGAVWQYTRFDESGMDLRALDPAATVIEICETDSLTFGHGATQCEEAVDEPEEECDQFTFGGTGC